MLITDAQVHLWEIDRPDRPWPNDGHQRVTPQLPDGFSAEQALAAMDEAGVNRVVIVPPSWIGENNATALEAAAAYPSRFAVLGRVDIRSAQVRDQLKGWLAQPGMLGIRITFNGPFAGLLDTDQLQWFWSACEEFGIPLMVLVPGMAAKLAPIVARHPHLTLVVDHLGAILSAKGAAAFTANDQVVGLATYPNVFVKLSSAPSLSNDPFPFADIEPYLRQLHQAFGAQRLMWGSDLTRLTSTYRECVEHIRSGLPFLSAEDKDWILGGTLAATLRWPEA